MSKELYKINKGLQEFLKEEDVKGELAYFGCNTLNELFERIGFLKLHPSSVINKFYPDKKKKQVKTTVKREIYKIKADGIDNVVVRLAKCCSPVFGEDIVGYITRSRGIVIHRKDCDNIQSLGYDCERLVDVEWDDGKHDKLPVEIKILTLNKIGVLAHITMQATELSLNVKDIKIKYTDDTEEKAIILLKVEVEDKNEVDNFIALLEQNENILDIKRGKKSK